MGIAMSVWRYVSIQPCSAMPWSAAKALYMLVRVRLAGWRRPWNVHSVAAVVYPSQSMRLQLCIGRRLPCIKRLQHVRRKSSSC